MAKVRYRIPTWKELVVEFCFRIVLVDFRLF